MRNLKEYPYDKFGTSEIRVICDTDCACEADDPFAVAHLLITSKFDIKAINAANFVHMPGTAEMSYRAICDLVEAMGMTDEVPVLHGCDPMISQSEYKTSEASDFIVEEAMKDDPRPLFVVVQGAITNIAVALQTKPEIAKRMHCIWIAGQPYPEGGYEFNMSNDVIASRIVMDSEMSLWQVPANAYSTMRVSFMTLAEKLYSCGKPGRYLCDQLWAFNKRMFDRKAQGLQSAMSGQDPSKPESYAAFCCGECWSLGDSPVVGLMLNASVYDRFITGKPYINDDSTYTLRPDNPNKVAVYERIDSTFILDDFFAKMKYQYGET